MTKRRPGRPTALRDEHGLTEAMRAVLAAKETNPTFGLERACNAAGYQRGRGWKWREDAFRAQNPDMGAREWWKRWQKLDHRSKVDRPPPTGSFIEFRANYLNIPTTNPLTGKTQMVGVTHEFQREFCEALDDPECRLLMVLLPVRFGKSAVMEQYAVYQWAKDPNHTIMWLSSNQDHLLDRAGQIQRMLTESELYPELHDTFGAWLGKPERASEKRWTAKKWFVAGNTSPERAPSFAGFGMTSRTYGARAHTIIIDDADDPSYQEDERKTILRKINGDLMSRPYEGGKIIYIGTRVGVTDVPSEVMKNPRWKVIVMSGEVEAQDGTRDSLCPEMYSYEDLQVLREQMGEELYAMMVLNDPAPEGSTMFPPALVDSGKAPFDIGEAPSDWPRTISLDPAAAGRAAAIVTAHDPRTGEIRIVDLEVIAKGGYEGMFSMVQSLVYRNKPSAAIIEATGGSSYFHEYPQVERFLLSEGCHTIVPFKTGVNKHDLEDGVGGLLKAMLERGKLRIADGTIAAREKMRPLIDDLLGFTPHAGKRKRFDTVLALWFAVKTIVSNQRALRGYHEHIPDPLAHRYRGNHRRIA